MKADIHPTYNAVNVVCGCGNKFEIKSTLSQETLKVDVCDQCHPFYTGKHKILDTEGRVDKFRRRYGVAAPKDSSEPSGDATTQ